MTKTKHVTSLITLILVLTFTNTTHADADRAAFVSALIYRNDGFGDYAFDKNGVMNGTTIAKDGSVVYSKSPGTYEPKTAHITDGGIAGITANWTSVGKVTMEVSATGNAANFVKVTNGVPLEWGEFVSGAKILWRVTLTSGSILKSVKITYTDLSGVVGTWGEPELSGFGYRKLIYIKSPASSEFFNYPVPIRVGESKDAKDCDAWLANPIQSDFADVRFTQKDGETLLPCWLEGVKGDSPKRVATFWVNIPQIPQGGLPIFIYYGRKSAKDLSDGEAVFDVFDDFKAGQPNAGKWNTSEAGKIVSIYEFAGGVIEFKATGSEGVSYYKIVDDGKARTFARYDALRVKVEASQPDLINMDMLASGLIELSTEGVLYGWIMVYPYASSPASIDLSKTVASEEESVNIGDFVNLAVAENGDLVLTGKANEGSYLSPVIFPPVKTNILMPSWVEERGPTEVGQEEARVFVDISAKNDGIFKEGCKNGKYYYVSKKDFAEGAMLRWRARFTKPILSNASPLLRLKSFSLNFWRGAISVISPNGKEIWASGRDYSIKWDSSGYDPSYNMQISYSVNGGTTYETIAKAVMNTGRYVWRVPSVITDKAMVRIADAFDEKISDASNAYFSIASTAPEEGAAGEEELALEESAGEEALSLEEKKAAPGEYELLIKVYGKDAKGNPIVPPKGFYKEGDVVMIKPAGYLWGKEERSKFLIVRSSLSAKEAKDLMAPGAGHKRKFKIDLAKQGLMDAKVAALKGMLSGKPVVKREAVEEKK